MGKKMTLCIAVSIWVSKPSLTRKNLHFILHLLHFALGFIDRITLLIPLEPQQTTN
jgi:hypothetical protein